MLEHTTNKFVWTTFVVVKVVTGFHFDSWPMSFHMFFQTPLHDKSTLALCTLETFSFVVYIYEMFLKFEICLELLFTNCTDYSFPMFCFVVLNQLSVISKCLITHLTFDMSSVLSSQSTRLISCWSQCCKFCF